MRRDEVIEEFLDDLASKDPVPGGGGASALSGAMGCALGEMVVSLTVGKKTYAAYREMLLGLGEHLKSLREIFLRLQDKDEEAFLPLKAAYGLPKETEEEQRARDRVMAQALHEACLVPLSVMETATGALESLKSVAEHGAKNVLSDAGVGASLLRAATEGAAFNVKINLKSMKDPEMKAQIEKRMDAQLLYGTRLYAEIMAIVEERL